MVVGIDEKLKVPTKFSITGVIMTLDGCVFERPVRSLDLIVRRANSLQDCFLILAHSKDGLAWSGDARCCFPGSGG